MADTNSPTPNNTPDNTPAKTPPPAAPADPKRTQKDPPNAPQKPPVQDPPADGGPDVTATDEAAEHEGATDKQVGNRQGPGAGFDQEPEKVRDKGGVASS